MNVEGEFTGEYNQKRGGFLYRFTCEMCGKWFTETSPDVSSPAVCEACFHGRQEERSAKVKRVQRWQRKKKEPPASTAGR